MIAGSSKPLTYLQPRDTKCSRAYSAASAMVSPWSTTSAPSERQRAILVRGAVVGITTCASSPSAPACAARASAWLPADAAVMPAARSSAERVSSA